MSGRHNRPSRRRSPLAAQLRFPQRQRLAAALDFTRPTSTSPAGSASITDFASNGLDSGVQYDGGYPQSFYGQPRISAFPGINPNVGKGLFVLPGGRAQYDALQIVFKQQGIHPAPGIMSSNLQVSYNLSRVVNAGPARAQPIPQARPMSSSTPIAWDNDNPNKYMGRSNLDHTNELSLGGDIVIKGGLIMGFAGHFFSAPPSSLSLDNSSGAPGEIFRTDVTGDGTTGDLLPGTVPGDYMHQIKGDGLNNLINHYNSKYAGQLTPAGQALVAAGLMTQAQLVSLNAVQQPIATAPTVPLPNSAQRGFDINFVLSDQTGEGARRSEPGTRRRLLQHLQHVQLRYPRRVAGQHGSTARGAVGRSTTTSTDPTTPQLRMGFAAQRGSGTYDQFAPRSTEFNLKLNF